MKKALIVITGASSGIGAAAAKAFADLGHPLLLIARRVDRLHALNLPHTLCQQIDVTDRFALKAAITQAEQHYGPVGCLINNAGVMLLGLMHEQSPEEWQQMLDINVMGVMNGIHAVLASMVERNDGTIINVSSVAGHKTFPSHAAYCGTKFAVGALTESLREGVADSSVRVITISPGVVETELLGHTTSDAIKSDYGSWKKTIDPLTADDVARAMVYAYSQPQSVCIREIVMAPTKQAP